MANYIPTKNRNIYKKDNGSYVARILVNGKRMSKTTPRLYMAKDWLNQLKNANTKA
jgi:hypothetical protein